MFLHLRRSCAEGPTGMQKAKNGESAHPATEADSSGPLLCVPPLSILREAEVVVPGDGGLHGAPATTF